MIHNLFVVHKMCGNFCAFLLSHPAGGGWIEISERTDTIETATLRAVRTGISQATSQIQMARVEEMGAEKGKVKYLLLKK